MLERLAEAGRGTWILAKVDVDANPRIAQAFGVQSIPMVVAVVGGQPLHAVQRCAARAAGAADDLRDDRPLRDRMPGIQAAEQAAAGRRRGAGGGARRPAVHRCRRRARPRRLRRLPRPPTSRSSPPSRPTSRPPPRWRRCGSSPVPRRRTRRRSPAPTPPPTTSTPRSPRPTPRLPSDRVESAFARLVATVGRTSGDDRDRVREHLVGLFELFPADDPPGRLGPPRAGPRPVLTRSPARTQDSSPAPQVRTMRRRDRSSDRSASVAAVSVRPPRAGSVCPARRAPGRRGAARARLPRHRRRCCTCAHPRRAGHPAALAGHARAARRLRHVPALGGRAGVTAATSTRRPPSSPTSTRPCSRCCSRRPRCSTR